MLNDTEIQALSKDIDFMLTELSTTYKIPVLSLAAVINARLLRIVVEMDDKEHTGAENYRKLMLTIAGVETDRPYTNFSRH